jgi:hypothetical protein
VEIKMKLPSLILAMIGMALVAAPVQAASVSEQQQTYLKECDSNASCRVEARDDGIEFVLTKNGASRRMLCKEDGSCFMLAPKGRRDKVSGLEILRAN